MNSTPNDKGKSEKMIQKRKSSKIKNCKNYHFNCNSFPGDKDKKEPNSKDLKIVFDLMENIINLTKDLWISLGVNDEIKNLISEKYNCFSILETENCKRLNFEYNQINFWLPEYQKKMVKHPDFYNGFWYIKNVFKRLEKFMTPTLSLFEKNITGIKFNIRKYDSGLYTPEIHEFKNIGNHVNKAIKEYLKELHHIITQFEPKNAINETEDIKELNEMNETDKIKELKRFNTIAHINEMKQKALSQIENSLQRIDVLLEFNKNESILNAKKSFYLVSRMKGINNITDDKTFETKFISSADPKASQKEVYQKEGSDIIQFINETTESSNLKEQTAYVNSNESFAINKSLYFENTTSSPEETLNVITSSSFNVFLVICLPILFLVIIAFLIDFFSKKYMARKEMRDKQIKVDKNHEIVRLNDS